MGKGDISSPRWEALTDYSHRSQWSVVSDLANFHDRASMSAKPNPTSDSSETPNLLRLTYQCLRRPDASLTFFPTIGPGWRAFLEVEPAWIESHPDCLITLLHPDDRASFQATLTQPIPTSEPWHWEGRYVLPSGKVKWVQCTAQPETLADGCILWSGSLIDMTNQRQLNAEVERLSFLLGLTERLQTSTDLYEIARFALEYLVQTTNCAFGDVKVIKSNRDQAVAYPIVNHISGEFVATYGEPAVAEMAAVLKQGQPEGQGLFWQVIRTGEALFVEDYANHPDAIPALRHPGIGQLGIFPIPASDGSIIGVLTLEARNFQRIQSIPQQDLISAACRILGARIEQAQSRERLQQKTQELEQALSELQEMQLQLVQTEKMSSLGQLVAGVAHELNNPVSFIQGNLPYAEQYIEAVLHVLGLYQQHYPQPVAEIQAAIEAVELPYIQQDLLRILNSMRVGSSRIRDIVLSLRTFSRLDEAEMKPVDIHTGIDNSLMILDHRLRAQAERPAVQVIKTYGELPLVACYPGQLNQVFMNLLVNAIDALDEKSWQAEPDADPPTLQICTQVIDDRAMIQISDNGLGIPEDVQSRLFDPFFTTKPVGKGTGMGLSISYKIVEKHGGTLSYESIPGKGTVFVIAIPIPDPG